MDQQARRVLIVDDEQGVCKLLEQFFTARGFSVTSVFSGEQALAWLKSAPVDVVLIDILLPGIHGIEVLKHAKQLHPEARVVMITGLEQEGLRAEARAFGADAYVTKPFDFSDPAWSDLVEPR